MESRLNSKSRKTVIITTTIMTLLALSGIGIYSFTKNKDELKTFNEQNVLTTEGRRIEQPITEEPQNLLEEPRVTENANNINVNEDATSEPATSITSETSTTTEPTTLTGTTIRTTEDVPNNEYVTERIEETERLTAEKYLVSWTPVSLAVVIDDIELQKTEEIQDFELTKEATLVNGEKLEKDEEGNVVTKVHIGDKITYVITVKNTGTVSLKNINIIDRLVGLEETIPVLAIGDSKEITVEYTVDKENIDNNEQIVNIVKATAEDPLEPEKTIEKEDDEIVPVNPNIEVIVSKVWNDSNNQDRNRPLEAKFKLLDENENPIKNKETDEDIILTLTPNNLIGKDQNENDIWQGIFEGLDKYDLITGNITKYKIKEIGEIDGVNKDYTVIYSYQDYVEHNVIRVENSYEPKTQNVIVTKVWENDSNNTRPEVATIRLYNGTKQIEELPTITKKENTWIYTFENLPVNENGKQIKYTAKEMKQGTMIPVENGGEFNDNYITTYSNDKLTIKNTYVEPKIVMNKNVDVGSNKVVNIGDILTYTIEIKNIGSKTAKNVKVEDYVPEGTELITEKETETRQDGLKWMTWIIPEITANTGTQKISFKVKVTNKAIGTEIINTAKVNNENTNRVQNPTNKAINIYEVESETQGQKVIVVIDLSLSMAADVNTDDSDRMAYNYQNSRWYALTVALNNFIDQFLANGKNEIAIVGYNSTAQMLTNYTNSAQVAKSSYADVFTQTHFNNLQEAAKQGEKIFNGQLDEEKSFTTPLSKNGDNYNIDVDGLTYLSTGYWHKTVTEGNKKKPKILVEKGTLIPNATKSSPCKLASLTNITSGLEKAQEFLISSTTSVIVMTDGEANIREQELPQMSRTIKNKAKGFYAIPFTNDASTLVNKVGGKQNVTAIFEANDTQSLTKAFKDVETEITKPNNIKYATTENQGKINLSEYMNKNINKVIIYKNTDDKENIVTTYEGTEFKTLLTNGELDIKKLINVTLAGKFTDTDVINIKITIKK